MRKALLIAGVCAGVLAGCTPGNNFRDLEGVDSRDPEKALFYNNVDQHPNVGVLCVNGIGVITTTREYDSILRVPELDDWCSDERAQD